MLWKKYTMKTIRILKEYNKGQSYSIASNKARRMSVKLGCKRKSLQPERYIPYYQLQRAEQLRTFFGKSGVG